MIAGGHAPSAIDELDVTERAWLWRLYRTGQVGPLAHAGEMELLRAIARIVMQAAGGKPPRPPEFREAFPDLWGLAYGDLYPGEDTDE